MSFVSFAIMRSRIQQEFIVFIFLIYTYIYIYIYIYKGRSESYAKFKLQQDIYHTSMLHDFSAITCTHTHTHTHIYIYIRAHTHIFTCDTMLGICCMGEGEYQSEDPFVCFSVKRTQRACAWDLTRDRKRAGEGSSQGSQEKRMKKPRKRRRQSTEEDRTEQSARESR